ncbi:MAG: hypothetical protein EBR83_01700 [Verrucomicrobia bacterium]|jgi:hypothetical protein|nr:hypothetical protein [Verrucomicrobiota bacterium]
MAKQAEDIAWLPAPEEKNYPAALSYLSLLYPEKEAAALVAKLRKAKVTQFKAKDIFRASQLSLLGVSNSHVKKDQKKIRKGIHLSPLLLVRSPQHGKVVIADGYHRLCAVYQHHEDIWIRCKIA